MTEPAQLTEHQRLYYAWLLTRRQAGDSVESLATTLVDSQVDLNPHQVEAALFACANPLSRGVILADEVGLGKTIEAGLVISQRWAERRRRILIIVPANLRKQWHQELQDKFNLQGVLLEAKSYSTLRKQDRRNPFQGATGPVICSYQFAKAKADDIKAVEWDLVVLDEAHRLRNVYKTSNVIAKTLKEALAHVHSKVLLTATPLQNSLLELFGLVSMIDDRVFGDIDSFRSQFTAQPREQAFAALRSRLATVCKRTLRRQVQQYVPYTARRAMVEEFNFVDRSNEADARVYELLDQKFQLFEGVFGASDEVLGAIGSGVDFERRIADIHVNMLKEGWDVTNLYTIVPLRAANARTLIEQSIGRGLRLPYGKRTDVAAVDRLNIVAHDKFQEIIDEANHGDSPIRLKEFFLEAPSAEDKKVSVQVGSGAMTRLGLTVAPTIAPAPTNTGAAPAPTAPAPVFATEGERQAARVVMEVIGKYEVKRDLVPTSNALLKPEVQSAILAEVTERLKPTQGNLLEGADDSAPVVDLSAVVAKTTEIVVQQTIDIPRIAVVPTGEVTTGFHPFKLGTLPNFQPGQREIVGQELRTNEQFTMSREAGVKEQRFEDYIVKKLIDFDDIDYFTQSELLYDLAGQAVAHYKAQNYSDAELHEVFDTYGAELARLIRAEMMAHFWEEATEYEVQVSRGFTELKPCNYTAVAGQTAHHYRETVTDLGKIKQMLFGGFARCLYPLQKFDSDTERRFAVILERDALKWFKPAKGQFQIYYKLGTEQPEYIPDFVAEIDNKIFMVETKARADIDTQEVQAKAAAAVRWCKHASDHAASVGSKPWYYLLVPHDEMSESKRLTDFLRFEVKVK